jgi:hypothetical protein
MVQKSKKKSKKTVKKVKKDVANVVINVGATSVPKSNAPYMRISGGRSTWGRSRGAANQGAALNALREQTFLQALQNATRQNITNPNEVEDLKKQIKELEANQRALKKIQDIQQVEGALSSAPSAIGISNVTSVPMRTFAFQGDMSPVNEWRNSTIQPSESSFELLPMSVRPPMDDNNPRRDSERPEPMRRTRPVIRMDDPRNPFNPMAQEAPF